MSDSGQPDGRDFQIPEEDTIVYRLYTLKKDESILAKLAADCIQHAQSITRNHIWHYDRFSLEVICAGKNLGSEIPPCLYGSTCFRDNLEDEWLVIYLLFSISRLYTQLIISVQDSDGQFLLIEAAHKLPSWLKPETAANRVFIHGGQLHIIPKPRSPAELTFLPVSTPTVREAVRIVSDGAIPTEASEPVQKCIQERLSRFSGDLGSQLHFAHYYVPAPVAHVMSHDPQLVSAAVHALCDRDPIDMQACRRMNYFSPHKHSSVLTGVKFTKCLYAKLLNQRFSCPRNSGFSIPPPSSSQQHAACEMGMKLTCGLEILLSRVNSGLGKAGGDVEDKTFEGLESNPRWLKFLESLCSRGFFQDELEGSRLYQQLLSSAKEYFVSHVQDAQDEEVFLNPLALAGRKALHILQNIPYSEEELIKKSRNLQPPDDDSWLQISPQELEAMMRKAAGYLPQDLGVSQPSSSSAAQQSKLGSQAAAAQGSELEEEDSGELDLQSMVYGMKSFVDKISSHEGAEFPWSGKDSEEVNFDADSFLDVMKAMLSSTSLPRKGKGASDLDSEEEGDEISGDFMSSEEDDDDEEPMAAAGVGGGGEIGRDEEMEEIMEQMDRELGGTEVAKSFEKMKVTEETEKEGGGDDTEVGGALQPVDVDFNLIKNLLESYTSQEGGAGPASNILQSLGVHIPEQD